MCVFVCLIEDNRHVCKVIHALLGWQGLYIVVCIHLFNSPLLALCLPFHTSWCMCVCVSENENIQMAGLTAPHWSGACSIGKCLACFLARFKKVWEEVGALCGSGAFDCYPVISQIHILIQAANQPWEKPNLQELHWHLGVQLMLCTRPIHSADLKISWLLCDRDRDTDFFLSLSLSLFGCRIICPPVELEEAK